MTGVGAPARSHNAAPTKARTFDRAQHAAALLLDGDAAAALGDRINVEVECVDD